MTWRTGVVRDFREVSALNLGGNSYKRLADRVLGGCVHHLLFDLALVGRPGEEAKLVALALAGLLKLEVINGVATVLRREFREKLVVVSRLTRLGYHDLRVVVRQLVHNVLELLAQFERLEGLQALGVDLDSGRLAVASAIPRRVVHSQGTYHDEVMVVRLSAQHNECMLVCVARLRKELRNGARGQCSDCRARSAALDCTTDLLAKLPRPRPAASWVT